MYKKHKNLLCCIVAFVVIGGFYLVYKSPYNETGEIFGMEFNLFTYAAVVIAAFAVFMVSSLVLEKVSAKVNVPDKLYSIISVAFVCAAMIYLFMVYKNEVPTQCAGTELLELLIREKFNHIGFTIVSLIAVALVIRIIRTSRKLPEYYGGGRKIAALVISFAGAVFSFVPNIYSNPHWGVYHIHAYTNSIVNVMYHQPYNDFNVSIYGHYGLVYYPFVKLFGSDTNAIMLTIALFAAVTYLAMAYVFSKAIKNNFMYTVSLLAVVGMATTYNGAANYVQTLPHRVLFPAITVAVITWLETHKGIKGIKKAFIEFILGTVAIIFNLETGLVSLVIICTYEVIKARFDIVQIIKDTVKAITLVFLCMLTAYIIVNIYNLAMGGSWNSIATFIYPIGSTQYDMHVVLRLPVSQPINAYTFHIIVFSLAAFSVIYRRWSEEVTVDEVADIAILLFGVSGLASLTYFMNRTAAGCIYISHIQLIAVLAVVADRFIGAELSKNKKGLPTIDVKKLPMLAEAFIACVVVVFFAVESVASSGYAFASHKNNAWNTSALTENYKNAAEWIPEEDVKAIGMAVPEIYYQCGADPMIYIIDWSDMMPDYMEEVERIIRDTDELVVSTYTLKVFEEVVNILEKYGFTEYDRFESTSFGLVHFKQNI